MGEDVDIIVAILADVVVDRLYPVTASLHTRIITGVLTPTGYGVAIETKPPSSDGVEATKLVHNF